MSTDLVSRAVDKLVETLTIVLSRFMTAGLPPRAIIHKLRAIPEFDQALYLRARRGMPLPMDPQTTAEKQEAREAIERVAAFFDDGFHERIVAELREVAEGLGSEA